MNTFVLYRSASRKGLMRPDSSVQLRAVAGWHQRARDFFARGFTAVELMVVLAIVAIMAAVAIPSYTSMGNRTRARSFASALIRDVQLARSTSIQTGLPAEICPGPTLGQCPSSSSWLGGWYIYKSDSSGALSTLDGTTVVGSQQADSSTTDTMTSSSAGPLVFNREGFAPAAGSGVQFTFQAGSSDPSKYCVVVTAIGAATLYNSGDTTPVGPC